jgi:amino acid transporter
MSRTDGAAPIQSLSVLDASALLIGVVVGVGIFRTPSLVAANVGSAAEFIGVWVLGGFIAIMGALVYAELGSAHPHAGGEYHFLSRAYDALGTLFAWARGTVIQTGAIAAVGFVYGDYAAVLLPLGPYGPSIHAVTAVAALTAINLIGTPQGTRTQWLLSGLTVLALIAIIAAGLTGASATPVEPKPVSAGAIGLAMVFVMLTYGGWNEAAYLSGELRDVRRNMVRALLIGTGTVTVLYVLANLAYLNFFGLEKLRASSAVGADLMRGVAGDGGALLLSFIVCVCALSTLNGTIFTGARTYYALGQDIPAIRALGVWNEQGDKPANALLAQAVIAIALIAFGAWTRDGFETMVAYTAPVFWFFLLLVTISVFVFRLRFGAASLPYRMPLYPLPAIIFAGACIWMLYSSLAYAGIGAMVGALVLIAGVPLLLIQQAKGAVKPAE